jgi:mannose-6-phosphate isomerase-like protein (cupin superfamily)
MSAGRVLRSLPFGKGAYMDIKVDDTEPESSPDRYAVEVHVSEDADAFYVPPHWHKNHSERMTVIEGRLLVTLDGKEIIATAEGDPVIIARRQVHSLKGFKGERLVFMEQALPGGAYKAEFFNDVLQNKNFGANPALLIRAFADHDTYLVLPLYFRVIDEIFITVAGWLASWFAPPKAKLM